MVDGKAVVLVPTVRVPDTAREGLTDPFCGQLMPPTVVEEFKVTA